MYKKEELKYKKYKNTTTGYTFKAMKWDGTSKMFFKLSDYLKDISDITMYTDLRYGGVLIFWSNRDVMHKYIVALKNDIIVWNDDCYWIYDEEEFLKYYKECKGFDIMYKKYKLTEGVIAFQYDGTSNGREKIAKYVESSSYSAKNNEFVVQLDNEFTFVVNPGDYCILDTDGEKIYGILTKKDFEKKFKEWK